MLVLASAGIVYKNQDELKYEKKFNFKLNPSLKESKTV